MAISKTTLFALVFWVIIGLLLLLLIPFGAAYVILIWTGEIIRYAFTFGNYKPRWGMSVIMPRAWGWWLLSELSMYLGMAFWLAVLVLLRNL